MKIEIEIAENCGEQWDEYVHAHPESHLSHRWAWRQIFKESFGHESTYLVARQAQKIVGLLPLTLVKSFLFGSAWISTPYLNGGGVLSSSEEAKELLLQKALELFSNSKTNYIELRHRSNIFQSSKLQTRSHKVVSILSLPNDSKSLFDSFPSKLRSQIRKPQKMGMTAKAYTKNEINLKALENFYYVFSTHMRDLGTPVYPKIFFDKIIQSFRQECSLFTVSDQNRLVSAAITISHRGICEIPWASSLKNAHRSSPNMLLYWKALETAVEQGHSEFDFGRSTTDSGQHRFKQQWGTRDLPLTWHYSIGEGQIPDINPKSAKFSFLVQCWQQLPLPIANTVGPWISRSLP